MTWWVSGKYHSDDNKRLTNLNDAIFSVSHINLKERKFLKYLRSVWRWVAIIKSQNFHKFFAFFAPAFLAARESKSHKENEMKLCDFPFLNHENFILRFNKILRKKSFEGFHRRQTLPEDFINLDFIASRSRIQ